MHVPDYEPSKEFFHFLKTVFGILKTLLQTAILLHAPHSLVPSLQHTCITTFHYFLRWINAFLNSRYQLCKLAYRQSCVLRCKECDGSGRVHAGLSSKCDSTSTYNLEV